MEGIIHSNELIELADRLDFGIITVDKELNIIDSNEIARPYLNRISDELTRNCPGGFPRAGDCASCFPGASIVCWPPEGNRPGCIFIKSTQMESYKDNLLKESERLKRVLLDNLNSSFLIVDGEGRIHRSHFVGDISLVLGQKGYAPTLEKVFSREIGEKILSKMGNLGELRSRDMSHFRFEINGQLFWLDFYMVPLGENSFFIIIDDKTGEHYLLERLDRLSEVEMNCLKVDELIEKTGNLVSGILGYSEIALSKNDNPVVADILDSIRKISSDGMNMLKVIKGYTGSLHREGRDGSAPLSEGPVQFSSAPALVDRVKALQMLENNEELYKTVRKDFIQDYGPVPDTLPALYRDRRKDAQILVHSIKGVAGIIGAYLLQDEANLLEGYMRKDEWDEADDLIIRFTESLRAVVAILKRGDEEEGKGSEIQSDLSLLTLDSRQKELLTELLSLCEAGDYNGLITSLEHYASLEWGDDWKSVVKVIREKTENIDFDGASETILSLI